MNQVINPIMEVIIPDSHPALEGHFPANPVVPGVMILDKVREAITQFYPGMHIEKFSTIKFLLPLLPRQSCVIKLLEKNAKYQFRCERNGELIAQGDMNLAVR